MIEMKITLHEDHDGDLMTHIMSDETVATGAEAEMSERIVEFIAELGLSQMDCVSHAMPVDDSEGEELYTGDDNNGCDGYCPTCGYAEECYDDDDILDEDDELEEILNILASCGINPSDCNIYKVLGE